MKIQFVSACSTNSYLNIRSSPKQTPADVTANISAAMVNNADTATISQAARNVLATHSNSAPTSGNRQTAVFDTDQGSRDLNISDYFSHAGRADEAAFSLRTLPPLLLPTRKNIQTLTRHIATAFPQFLAQNNIPSAPSRISYDTEGQIQLPADYAYAPELKQALANNPTMAKELKTVHALSSQSVEIGKSNAFHQEYATAATQPEAKAIVAKYSFLFGNNRHYSTIALDFSEGGLNIIADGKPLF